MWANKITGSSRGNEIKAAANWSWYN